MTRPPSTATRHQASVRDELRELKGQQVQHRYRAAAQKAARRQFCGAEGALLAIGALLAPTGLMLEPVALALGKSAITCWYSSELAQ